MSNLNNYNFNNIDAFLSNSEYYDLYLSQDEYGSPGNYSGVSIDCAAVRYDFANPDIFCDTAPYDSPYGTQYGYDCGYPYNGIYGVQYGNAADMSMISSLSSWSGATNSGFTFSTFGLTGIDNGYITFDKTSGDTCNTALLDALTGTTVIVSGDTRLVLSEVTGMTGNYIYPIEQIETTATTGDYARFCGGFYQGYYKLDGYDYQTLPVRMEQAWVAEFWLRKGDNCDAYSGSTILNDTFPNNKGFFFYMGTRAENKFWNVFEGNNTGCTSGCCNVSSACTGTVTTFCTAPKETDISFIDDKGHVINLNPPQIEYREITNPFLIYGRAGNNNRCGTCGSTTGDGLGTKTACDFTGDSITVSSITQTVVNTINPFLIYGRASTNPKCGSCGSEVSGLANKTACDFSGFTEDLLELDKDADIVDNALGFRIKDDGSIGYRLLTYTSTCVNDVYTSGVTVEEAYSVSGMVSDDEWHKVDIRFIMPEYDECELKIKEPRKGKLMFYVDGFLKFVVNEFDELVARRVNEHKDKQLGVPFNMSLGGGTQGLLEHTTFDGQDLADLGLHLEQNFAGTFIGDISQFRFHTCDLYWCGIKNNYEQERARYGK